MQIFNTSIGWYISKMIHGKLIEKNYYGYTKKEAIVLFKKEHNLK